MVIEIIVVAKRIFAAISWLILYDSAISIVDIAVGVPAWSTTADVWYGSKFMYLLVKNINAGKIINFKNIEYFVPLFN